MKYKMLGTMMRPARGWEVSHETGSFMRTWVEMAPIYWHLLGKRRRAELATPVFTEFFASDVVVFEPDDLLRYNRLAGNPKLDNILPTFPFVLGFPTLLEAFGAQEFPMPAMGLIHTAFSFKWDKVINVDDLAVSSVVVRLSPLLPHDLGTLIPVQMNLVARGEELWSSRLEFLHRSPHKEKATKSSLIDAEGPWQEIASEIIQPVQVLQYALLGRDINPIHLSRLTARLFGQKALIAHGMFLLARVLSHLMIYRHHDYVREGSFQFLAPVRVPGHVTVAAQEILGVREDLVQVSHGEKNLSHLRGKVRWA